MKRNDFDIFRQPRFCARMPFGSVTASLASCLFLFCEIVPLAGCSFPVFFPTGDILTNNSKNEDVETEGWERKLIVEYLGASWQADETEIDRAVDHFRVINRSESPIMIGGEGPGIPFSIYVLDNGSEAGDWDFPDINEFAVFFPLAPGDQWLFSKLRPDICYPWKFRVISVVECRNGRRQEFISDSQWVTKWESCQQ